MFSPFTEAICLACRGKARAQAAASTASLFMYSSVGGLGIDCQGMDWMGHQIVDKIIHKAMPGHGPQPLEFGRHHLRSEEHTSELQSREKLVCRLLLEKKK